MAKPKGAPKIGGRTKDTPNKLTQTARQLFTSTLEGQVPNLLQAFEEVRQDDPAKYLELFAKYAQYFMPKQVDVTTKGESVKQLLKIGGVEIEL